MKSSYLLIVFAISFCLAGFPAKAQTTKGLQLEITNIKTAKGQIRVAIYDTAESFLTEKVFMGIAIPVTQLDKMTYQLDDLASGIYAISVYHDKNSNGVLDSNFLRIPKEPYGFSNNARKRFGPPSFLAARFTYTKPGQLMAIKLK